MKVLVILFFLLIPVGLFAQSVMIYPDGTHSVVHDHGIHKVIVNPDGTHAVVVDLGTNNILVNPDGTHSQIIDHRNSNIIVNSNGTHSILAKRGNFQQVLVRSNYAFQPITLKKRGGKMVILPDGSVIHFEKVKTKRMSKIKTIKHLDK